MTAVFAITITDAKYGTVFHSRVVKNYSTRRGLRGHWTKLQNWAERLWHDDYDGRGHLTVERVDDLSSDYANARP